MSNRDEESGKQSDTPTVYSETDDSLPDPIPITERKRGDTWRTATIKKCSVCHTLTNKWVISGYPSTGPRCRCPVLRREDETIYETISDKDRHRKHDELEELVDRRTELQERLQQYDSDSKAAERTRTKLRDELQVLDEQIEELRAWFSSQFDDVEGVDPESRKITTEPPVTSNSNKENK